MIYDEETKRWYLSDAHKVSCKRGLEENDRLIRRLPLSHEQVVEQQKMIAARYEKYMQEFQTRQRALKIVIKLIFNQKCQSTYIVFEFQKKEWCAFLKSSEIEKKNILLRMMNVDEREHHKLFIQHWEPLSQSQAEYNNCIAHVQTNESANASQWSFGEHTRNFLQKNRDGLVDLLMELCVKQEIHRTDWALALAQIEQVFLKKLDLVYFEQSDISHLYGRYKYQLRSLNNKLSMREEPLIKQWIETMKTDIIKTIENGGQIDLIPYRFVKEEI